MPTGTRTTDSFTEGLRKLLSNITDLKMTDDADMPFIIQLETIILGKLKNQGSDALQGGPMGGGGPMMPGGPMPGGPMPGGPPPGMGGPPPPAGVPGLAQGPAMPNPDELRRVLAGPGR